MTEDREDAAVVVVFPVLRRPHRVRPLVESLEAATPEPHRTVFVATAGDDAMIEEIKLVSADWPIELEVLAPNRIGDYARKINHVLDITVEPFLFTGADDLDFHPGWIPAGLRHFDDPKIGVVGTQDLAPTTRARAGTHATHFFVRRRYAVDFGTIDARGKIFHDGYPHEYVDDELVETAKFRGAWSFAADSVVEHLHPSWGKAPSDPLYRAQSARMNSGRRVFARRRRLWTSR